MYVKLKKKKLPIENQAQLDCDYTKKELKKMKKKSYTQIKTKSKANHKIYILNQRKATHEFCRYK